MKKDDDKRPVDLQSNDSCLLFLFNISSNSNDHITGYVEAKLVLKR